MLIYARISNAMEDKDLRPVVDAYPHSVYHFRMLAVYVNQLIKFQMSIDPTPHLINASATVF